MSFRLWEIAKDPEKRAVISWLGGGAVLVAGGIWTVVTFFVEHKEAPEKRGGTTVTVSGQGIASGGNTSIGGSVTIGLDEKAVVVLVARLLAERQTPAAPGSRQAVAEAVDATAKRAAAGKPRAKQALELLNAGKIAEAVPLFEAEAAKEAASRSSAKKAVAAYRNLGAIAGLADPKRALEAYEKAIALDSDDLESLYWAGAIQIDYGDLNEAQARLDRVLALAKKNDRASYKYWALTGLGDIKERRGNLAGALKSYSDSLAIISRLAKSDPGNAEWQRDLSVAYNKVGNVQGARGDLQAALKSYSDSLAIISRLAKSDPGNAEWQRDLSVSYEKIGGMQEAQGDLQGALKSDRDDLAITERLAKSDPGNAEWQRDLSVAYSFVGNVQGARGDLQAALKSYSDSLAIISRLAKSDPGNAEWQRDLAMSFGKLALVLKQSGDNAKARDFLSWLGLTRPPKLRSLDARLKGRA